MHIVIESGLMYTVSVVIVFVVFLTSNNAQYAVSDCVSSESCTSTECLVLIRDTSFR